MLDDTQSIPLTTKTNNRKSCFSALLLIMTWFWIFVVVIVSCLTFLILSSISLQTPNWYYVLVQGGMGVLIALPLLPLTFYGRESQYRATYQWYYLCR